MLECYGLTQPVPENKADMFSCEQVCLSQAVCFLQFICFAFCCFLFALNLECYGLRQEQGWNVNL